MMSWPRAGSEGEDRVATDLPARDHESRAIFLGARIFTRRSLTGQGLPSVRGNDCLIDRELFSMPIPSL